MKLSIVLSTLALASLTLAAPLPPLQMYRTGGKVDVLSKRGPTEPTVIKFDLKRDTHQVTEEEKRDVRSDKPIPSKLLETPKEELISISQNQNNPDAHIKISPMDVQKIDYFDDQLIWIRK